MYLYKKLKILKLFSFYIFLQAPQCGRPHNKRLYRSGLDPLSATNLCYVIFISYLFSCITFHFRQVMQPPHTFTLFHSPAVAALRCCYNPLRASHYVIELCLEKSNQQYFFKSSISGRTYSQPVSSGI